MDAHSSDSLVTKSKTKSPENKTKADLLAWNLHPKKRRIAEILAFNGYEPGGKRNNGAFSLGCDVGKVSKQTLSRWAKEPAFMEYVEQQKALLVDESMACIRDGVTAKNPIAAMFLLKTIRPAIYDEQFRAAKLRHELAMKHEALKHQHALEIVEARARAGEILDDEVSNGCGRPGIKDLGEKRKVVAGGGPELPLQRPCQRGNPFLA